LIFCEKALTWQMGGAIMGITTYGGNDDFNAWAAEE
jgi:hypothetical protein